MAIQSDYWRVNSYGYPNPFINEQNARQAWETLLSFYDYTSYKDLKAFWESGKAPRQLDPHAVESWKASFEEFGLLYVISGSNTITITPAGAQFREAAEAGDPNLFAYIGLSLLLRYPLRGPRLPKSPRHGDSDLLPYWFLYAVLLESENYIWWSEFERLICTVFTVDEANRIVERIRSLRTGDSSLDAFPLPTKTRKGGFYNSLNQVIVHASLNYMTMDKSNDDGFYEKKERRHWINSAFRRLVESALGGAADGVDCFQRTDFISSMPSAPTFVDDEEGYFCYLGDTVPPPNAQPAMRIIDFQGESVAVLQAEADYRRIDETRIGGAIDRLCRLQRGQRIILSSDSKWTYIVRDKTRISGNDIGVTVQRARPIVSFDPISLLLEKKDG